MQENIVGEALKYDLFFGMLTAFVIGAIGILLRVVYKLWGTVNAEKEERIKSLQAQIDTQDAIFAAMAAIKTQMEHVGEISKDIKQELVSLRNNQSS